MESSHSLFNDKEILLVSCYIIMKLSELSEDYIAEMPVKLGLVYTQNCYLNIKSTKCAWVRCWAVWVARNFL